MLCLTVKSLNLPFSLCFLLQEHHLQRALSAQQVYGTAEALVIPVPDIGNIGDDRYGKLYRPPLEFKPPKQYVHVQGTLRSDVKNVLQMVPS